jgi:hypothetical protein
MWYQNGGSQILHFAFQMGTRKKSKFQLRGFEKKRNRQTNERDKKEGNGRIMSKSFRILCLGDVVGPLAVEEIGKRLWRYRREQSVDFVVANGENADVGNGIMPDSAQALLSYGVDVLTSGNHIWQKQGIRSFLDQSDCLIRPANYPGRDPGRGYTIQDGNGFRILVINVLGTVFLDALDNPFYTVDKILAAEKGRYDFSVLDIHAEATAEKIALAHYLDGRIQVIFGTHTHVQTADEQILPAGTGYITDLGMCGVQNGVLGVETSCIIEKFTTHMPVRFRLAEGEVVLKGCLFDVDSSGKGVLSVKRVSF